MDDSNPNIQRWQSEAVALHKLTGYFTASNNSAVVKLPELKIQDRYGTFCICNLLKVLELPVTGNGVVDKDKLVRQFIRHKAGERVAPSNEVERQVAQIWQTKTGFLGSWEYNTDLFKADTIAQMTGHFQTLLEAIAINPQQKISEFGSVFGSYILFGNARGVATGTTFTTTIARAKDYSSYSCAISTCCSAESGVARIAEYHRRGRAMSDQIGRSMGKGTEVL